MSFKSNVEAFSTGLSITGIFVLALGVYFLSALLPGALDNFFAVNTTGWDTGSASLWVIIPLAIVAGVVLIFIPRGEGGA